VLAEKIMSNGHLQSEVELVLPAESSMIRLARLVASGVASAAGFSSADVEDVRIGVDELCSALIEAGGSAPIRLGFACHGGTIEVLGSTAAGPGGVDPERFALSRQILAVVMDEHRVDLDGDDLRFWIRKRAGD
jgi:anti-sigma regulatory factor (Ser/Thr protein kinase)